jgi:transcriptional regulator with XRE-family HTH domain
LQIPQLRQWREYRGLTQRELAAESGVSPRSIAGYEAGGGARPNTARKLAQALNIEVADFFEEPVAPKAQAPPSPEQPPLNGFEEEGRASALTVQFDLWRAGWEEDAARWSRAIERGAVLESLETAGVFAAGVIEQGAHATGTITNALIPAAERQLPPDDAERERRLLLETKAEIEESMHAVIGAVESIAGPSAEAAAQALRKYLDPLVVQALNEKAREYTDHQPDFELWWARERRRRRQAGAMAAPAERSTEGERKRPTA